MANAKSKQTVMSPIATRLEVAQVHPTFASCNTVDIGK